VVVPLDAAQNVGNYLQVAMQFQVKPFQIPAGIDLRYLVCAGKRRPEREFIAAPQNSLDLPSPRCGLYLEVAKGGQG